MSNISLYQIANFFSFFLFFVFCFLVAFLGGCFVLFCFILFFARLNSCDIVYLVHKSNTKRANAQTIHIHYIGLLHNHLPHIINHHEQLSCFMQTEIKLPSIISSLKQITSVLTQENVKRIFCKLRQQSSFP